MLNVANRVYFPPFLQASWSKFTSSTQEEFDQTVNPSLQEEMLVSNEEKPSERGKSIRWTHKRRASPQAQCCKPPAHTWVTHIFRGLFNFPLMENTWQMRGEKWIRDGTTGEKKKHRYLFFLSSTDEHIALTVTCYRDRGEGWRRRDDNISHSTVLHNVR